MTAPRDKSEVRLEPCPFCGCDYVRYRSQARIKMHAYECGNDDCDVMGPLHPTKEAAREAWNRRSPPAPQPALTDEQREALEAGAASLRGEFNIFRDHAFAKRVLQARRPPPAPQPALTGEQREAFAGHAKWLHLVAERLYKQQRDYSIANTCDEAADAIDALLRALAGKGEA